MKIILSGILSRTQYSEYPGPRDSRLAFADGFRKLGHEVYFFEEVVTEDLFDSQGQAVPFGRWAGKRVFMSAMTAYGLQSHAALILDSGRSTHGMTWDACQAVAREADLLLTIGGRFRAREILDNVGHRAYLDINPGKTQAYAFEYGVDYGLEAFDSHFSVGLCIGGPDCALPTGGLQWRPLLWPVSLDRWRPAPYAAAAFTTITTFGKKKQFKLGDQMSGGKVEQWLEYVDLPTKTGQQALELALPISQVKEKNLAVLAANGWRISNAQLLRTPADYVSYVSASRAEFSVANGRYTRFGTGWFSDRTARYLSTGRPALVQSTGIESQLPVGEGLLTFGSPEEALEGIERINADYRSHSRKAREFAEEFLDSDRVLTGLLEAVGLA